jgi:DNA replication protein DnaC
VRHIRNLVSRNGGRVGSVMPRNIATVPKQQASAAPACSMCGDTGWKTVQDGVNRSVTRCDCRQVSRTKFLIQQAKFPPRYENCDLEGYETGTQSSLATAKIAAQKFIANYPIDKIGFLLIGPSGAGKTHLSVAILRELIIQKGIACLFCDYRDLLKQIQNSYNPSVQVTELDLLRPVFQAEVLVLDDLGAVKPTEWVWDMVSVILNTRYNENRTTIITSNFMDGPAAVVSGPRAAAREETLGDRIGERMRSRLFEMCRVVNVNAPDYRQKFRGTRV